MGEPLRVRIRSVWPEFWPSTTLAELSRERRLAFIALWNYADDHGRGRCDYRLLKAALFPLDGDVTPETLREWMNQMESLRLIQRYEHLGRTYFAVRSWGEFQHPNRPKPSLLPEPPTQDEAVTAHDSCTEPSLQEGKGVGEGVGEATDLPRTVLAVAQPYLADPKTCTYRLGHLRGLLQGITNKPVPEATLVRAIQEMAVAGADFRTVVVKAFVDRAARVNEAEAGLRAAAGSHGKGEGFAENDL